MQLIYYLYTSKQLNFIQFTVNFNLLFLHSFRRKSSNNQTAVMEAANGSISSAVNTSYFSSFDVTTKAVITIAYGVVFTVALLGNILIIFLIFNLPSMRCFTNMLLVNMCVANLLVASFAMPYSVAFLFLRFRWFSGYSGSVTCKLVHFLYALSISASILSLLLISMDRYYAVLHSLKRRPHFLRSARLASFGVWFVSFVSMAPYLFKFNTVQYQSVSLCIINWSPLNTMTASQVYFIALFIIFYATPLLAIATAYSLIAKFLWQRKIPGHQTLENRRVALCCRRKVVRMLIIVVVVFAFCWIPAHVMHFLSYYKSNTYVLLHPLVVLLSFWLCHANSALSPWLFLTMHHNFRRAMYRLVMGPSVRGIRRSSLSTHCYRCNSTESRQESCVENKYYPAIVKEKTSVL